MTSSAYLWSGANGAISDGFEGSTPLGAVHHTGTFNNSGNDVNNDIAGTAKFPLAVNTSDQCLEEVDTNYTLYENYWWQPASSGDTSYALVLPTPSGGTSTITVPFVPIGAPGSLSNVNSLGNFYVLGSDSTLQHNTSYHVPYFTTPTAYYCWDGTNQYTLPQPAGQLIRPTAVNAATTTLISGGSTNTVAATQIVGGGSTGGYIWEMVPTTSSTKTFGPPQNLNDLLAPQSGFANFGASSFDASSIGASGINDNGCIVGTAAVLDSSGNPVLDSNSHPVYHGVMLIPAQITKVFSNQFTGLEFNGLPTGLPYHGDLNNPMIMGCNTGTTANLSLVIDKVPTSFIAKFFVGVRQAGQTTILASTQAQLAPTRTHLQFSAIDGTGGSDGSNSSNKYEIILGYDANGNGQLDPSEVSIVYAGSGTSSSSSPQDKVVVITQSDYTKAATYLQNNVITSSGSVLAFLFPTAASFAQTFINPATEPPGAASTYFTLYSNDPNLKHPLGANWTASGSVGSATAAFYTFNATSNISSLVANSKSIKQIILNQIALQKGTVLAYFAANPTATVYDSPNLPYTASNFSFSDLDPRSDLWLTFGSVNTLTGHFQFTATKNGTAIDLTDANYDGTFTDLYDFYYFASAKYFVWETGLNKSGATLQAGYPTLGNSGEVFESKVVFSRSGVDPTQWVYSFQ